MADNRIEMPRGSGGIVRYFDDYKSKLEFSPYWVIAVIVLIIVAEIILHKFVSL